MKSITLTALIISLIMLVFVFSSCHHIPPENMEFPNEDCVMVYTISENEHIRILYNPDSDFHLYGEWIEDNKTTPVYLRAEHTPSMFAYSDGTYTVSIETFDPNEEDHVHSSNCNHTWTFDKGALNSSKLLNYETNKEIPITYSTESCLDFQLRWVSDVLLAFKESNGKIYKEEAQNFWYSFEEQKGEWLTNGTAIPIRMEFSAVTPINVTLRIYDVSEEREKEILFASGEIIDENTFVSQELSGTMFYEGTVTKIKIVKTNSET